ncbi:MAG: hypothetical protein V4671_13350 [Armatimonadota bacterium]
MEENEKDIRSSTLRLALGETKTTRRGFFTSAIVLAGAAALAGCGGGGDSGGGRSNGTYQNSGAGNQATVSVSIDRDGLLTFWVLFANDEVADYGQSYIDDDGFFTQTFAGFRTFGRVRGGRVEGRTEDANNTSDGFDWVADRYIPSSYLRPGNDLVGTYNGFTRRDGVDYTTFLTVAPDGTATIFSELDLAGTNGIDELLFEAVAFDRSGNVPNDDEYFLFLFGDRFELRPSGNSDVRLRITFGASVPSVDIEAGELVELVLERQFIEDVRSRRAVQGGTRNISPAALDRIFNALREGRKVKS